MIAVILAAGRGTRLGLDIPKALIEISGKPIIHRQIEQFRKAGINDIIVIGGYRLDLLRESLRDHKIRLYENPFYKITDNLVSFYLALKNNYSECVVSHSDMIFDDDLIELLLDSDGDVILPIDAQSMNSESMKIRLEDGQVAEVCKNIEISDAAGESVPLIRFSKKAVAEIIPRAKYFIDAGNHQAYLEDVLAESITSGNTLDYRIADITGMRWMEIDTSEDLAAARRIFE
ncbi:MAG: phosphocholine cytidylyltransferase family protein [FCB group bacterium]|nr:phosphocholine cytidylyltransferase family protein [FCB group bacterium]